MPDVNLLMSTTPLCNICGLRASGSKEHLPGVAAANDQPVRITYLQPGLGSTQLQRVVREEEEGFIVRTICGHCNRRTGGSYGTAYKSFVQQFSGASLVDATLSRTWVSLERVQPLRILKQMSAMFLAAQPELDHESWHELRNFVLRRDKKLPAGVLRFYLYRNSGSVGRISGFAAMGFLLSRPHVNPIGVSEISWPPVGIVFATEASDSHPELSRMKEITDWGHRSFKNVEDVGFSVPQLLVEADWPLGFGSRAEVNKWIERTGAVWMLPSLKDETGLKQASALIEQIRKGST